MRLQRYAMRQSGPIGDTPSTKDGEGVQARRGGPQDRNRNPKRKALRIGLFPDDSHPLLEGPLVPEDAERVKGSNRDPRPPRRRRRTQSGRHHRPEDQSSGAERPGRECLEEGQVPGADRQRRGDPIGSRRVEYDAEGGGTGGEVQRKGSMETLGASKPERRERKEGRKRQREVRWKEQDPSPGGGREEGGGSSVTLVERVDADGPFLRIPATLKPAEPMPEPHHRSGGEDLDSVMPGTDPEIAEESESSRKGMEMRADF